MRPIRAAAPLLLLVLLVVPNGAAATPGQKRPRAPHLGILGPPFIVGESPDLVLQEPTAVAFDATYDRVVIADAGSGLVHHAPLSGLQRGLPRWSTLGPEARLARPAALAAAGDGRLYVLSAGTGAVSRWRFDPAGESYVRDAGFDRLGASPGLGGPTALAAGPTGAYVLDGAGGRVLRLVEDDEPRWEVVAADADWVGALALAVDEGGCIYVADTVHRRVVRVTPGAGEEVFADAFQGVPDAVVIRQPEVVPVPDAASLTIRADGSVGASGPSGTGLRVRVIDNRALPPGQRILSRARPLQGPTALAIDRLGRVIVSDAASHTVRFLDPATGLFVTETVPAQPGYGEVRSVAFHHDGAHNTDKVALVGTAEGRPRVVLWLGRRTADRDVVAPPFDLYVRDAPGDDGGAPPHDDAPLASPDILIRHRPDVDLGRAAQVGLEAWESQDPRYGWDNYVYVAVHNRGERPMADVGLGLWWGDPGRRLATVTDWSWEGFRRPGDVPPATPRAPDRSVGVGAVAPGATVVAGPLLWRPPAPDTIEDADGRLLLRLHVIALHGDRITFDGPDSVRRSNDAAGRFVRVVPADGPQPGGPPPADLAIGWQASPAAGPAVGAATGPAARSATGRDAGAARAGTAGSAAPDAPTSPSPPPAEAPPTWAVAIGGPLEDVAGGLAVGPGERIAVAASYRSDTVHLGAARGPAGRLRRPAGAAEAVFLARYDGTGGVRSARTLASSDGTIRISSLALDAAGGVRQAGLARGAVSFGDPEGSAPLLTGAAHGPYLARHDRDGHARWALLAETWAFAGDPVVAGAVDGDAVWAAPFAEWVTLRGGPEGPATLATGGAHDVFVAGVAPDGAVRWLTALQGPSDEAIRAAVRTPDGGAVLVGAFEDAVAIGPDHAPVVLDGAGGADGLVVRLDAAGRVLWAHRLGGPFDDHALAVTVEAGGTVVVSAVVEGAATLDDARLPVGSGGRDTLVLALDGSGALAWAVRCDEPDLALASIAALPAGGVGAGVRPTDDGAELFLARWTGAGAPLDITSGGTGGLAHDVDPWRQTGPWLRALADGSVTVLGQFGPDAVVGTTVPFRLLSRGGGDLFLARLPPP